MNLSSSPLQTIFITTTVISTLLLFFLLPSPTSTHRRRLLLSPPTSAGSLINYAALPSPTLPLLLAVQFTLIVRAASAHFSPAVAALSARLRLTPSTAAVTLLALGNGAPDVFASIAAVRAGHARTGLGAILSAGAFVSAFVVGAVAVIAAPFPLEPVPFVRDAFAYLIAASALFYIYLSAEIFLWQAVGFVAFYVFFVGLVFWMDLGAGGGGGRGRGEKNEEEMEMGLVGKEVQKNASSDWEPREAAEDSKSGSILCGIVKKAIQVWEIPAATILRLTIPSTTPTEWSRFYTAANIILCPLALLYSFNSFIKMDIQIVFLLPQTRFPLWSVVLLISFCFAVAHFFLEQEPLETEHISITIIAFIMSVFWISTMAGELLNCLAAIGTIMELPPAILGLTVLAWGNSVGDLVADVAVAKAGQPALAMAGCFVGPMFNMMIGLGTALVIETANVYPGAYVLHFHVSIVVAFVFLLVSLMGSLLVVTWCRFRVPRFWGFCLVGLYLVFTAVSLAIARFSG